MDARIQGRLGTAFTGLVNGLRQACAASGPRTSAALLERVRSASVDRAGEAALPRQRIAAPGSLAPPPIPTEATGAPVDGPRVASWSAGLQSLIKATQDGVAGGASLERLGGALTLLGDVARERDDLLSRARGELS